MGAEMMDVEQLAVYLQRDVREVGKLANRGHLPGHKVGGVWRFARAEINQWIESQMPHYTTQQLTALEQRGESGSLLATYLSASSIAVPLAATSRASVLKQLVKLAEESFQVYDPEALFEAIKAREELASTAIPNGVALPHPRRPLPNALGEAVLAFGRTTTGIPFGGERGLLTDLFFLIACRDDRTHLAVLARLTRLLQQPGFLDALRETETPAEAYELIVGVEQELLNR
jgi:PTS system nitrogen regulatory IIA component